MNKVQRPRAAMKAERTRAAILAAAEEQFARGGFATTRLDDVAEAVGMTGAALFYYFRDKGALYDATMERAFGTLAARLSDALSSEASIAERIERAVEAWIETVVARPALARLILRHIADSEQQPRRHVYPGSDAFLQMALALFERGKRTGAIKPLHDHPYHLASAIIGSTIFYVSALALLVPSGDFDPRSPDQVAAHKRDAVRTVRYFLGIPSKEPPVSAPKLATAAKKRALEPSPPAPPKARARRAPRSS
jgi:TetR/AcrR family transcriptional regulator